MRSWRAKALVLLGVLSVVAAACGNDNGGETGGAGGTATGSTGAAKCNADIQVGVAFDVGGLGDKSFNDAANRGLQQALADGLVCADNAHVNEANATGSDRDQNVQALADAGVNLVIGVGFAFSPGINTIAPDYPDTDFMIVDGYATCGTACGLTNDADAIPNVADYTFKEQEGSFLVGAAAALKCQCDTIGFLGGQTGPLIEKFQAGYEAGAKAVNPDIKVLVEYIGDDVTAFNDPVKGEALSTKMYDEGAEIIYHASGASGAGLFNAAVKANKLAIGVDSDQYLTASPEQQPLILTSMLKRVDVAVYNAVQAVGDGKFESTGSQVFGMAEGGVDYATSNPEQLTSDITEQLDKYKQQIIDGTIVVPEKPSGS
ncbi:MAG TPA: BMP family ABC transporter substrate-binding protein [Actinomycetota bacterium]|jgi:basic membrane protein A|nr:BMP family ABC transporter substrate-binding protein [Actinomycetota bacterium]